MQHSKDSIPIEKVLSFGSDGASVMLGCNTGVAKRLLDLNGLCIAIHCVNHRQSLACKGAADDVPYVVFFFLCVEALG